MSGLTRVRECGWAGGAVDDQVTGRVLGDGRTQRSRRRVVLGQTRQTGRFDEPGTEHNGHLTSNKPNEKPESPNSPGHVSLCPLVGIMELHKCVTQRLCAEHLMDETRCAGECKSCIHTDYEGLNKYIGSQ